jgi:hypothetical protein
MTFAARLRLLLVLGLLLGGVLLLDSLGSYGRPPCPWWQSTGTYCPACGGERSLAHLARGQWLAALRDNAFVVLALPGMLVWLWWGYKRKAAPDPRFWYLLAGLGLLYTIMRNLPAFSALAPA